MRQARGRFLQFVRWHMEIFISRSLTAGLQFENARIGHRKVQFLAEYFKGPSPNRQFFTQNASTSTPSLSPLPLDRFRHVDFMREH